MKRKKKVTIKSWKIPFLPFHIVSRKEILQVIQALQTKWVSDRVSGSLLDENRRYKNRYGPLGK